MQLPQSDKSNKNYTCIGAMSGTSMDGIDLALIKTDGENIIEYGSNLQIDYSRHTRELILQALEDAKSLKAVDGNVSRADFSESLMACEQEITNLHVSAIAAFLEAYNLDNSEIDCIGFHGQTVLHRPDAGFTLQLGNGEMLAQKTGIDVVYDMRANDMIHGGQGAPLIPIYHQALAQKILAENLPQNMTDRAFKLPIAFVNIGGISNISFIGQNGELVAFDTGPGNALIDQWVQDNSDQSMDIDGLFAQKGRIITQITKQYLADSFFQKPLPKSLDRIDFPPLEKSAASLEDGARTLCYISAAAIIKSVDLLPQPPKLWVICGGGRKHPSIMADLRDLASYQNGQVVESDAFDLDGDFIEAEAWGYLAVRSIKNLPLTYPLTTGCKAPVSGGVLAKAKSNTKREV